MRLEQSTHCVFAYTGHRIDGLTGHPMSAPVPKKTRKEDYQVRLLRELCSRIFLDPCEKKVASDGTSSSAEEEWATLDTPHG